MNVKNVHADSNCRDYFSLNCQSPIAVPFVMAAINRVINLNWRLLFKATKKQWDETTGAIYLSILKPIFENVPIQNFYQKNILAAPK